MIEDLDKSFHLDKSLEPYNRSDYCDARTNEERLNAKFGKYKGK